MTSPEQTCRRRFPRLERRHPWLPLLLDCLALVDAGVAAAISLAGKLPACGSGCGACCHQPIPVTPLEAAGLQLCARDLAPPAILKQLIGQPERSDAKGNQACRFLLRGSCAVYPLRPVACRRYIVFGARCAEGEDPVRARPQDVLWPSREELRQALALTLPYYAALGAEVPDAEQAFAFCAKKTVDLASISRSLLDNAAPAR
jgi:Fe-S-cluster containining protein